MDKNVIHNIETKMKKLWNDANLYETKISTKPSYSILDFFPYPSGIGLHVGHTLGYISTDIFARFKRMEGYNVLYSMGFDAFGLPAEQFAIQTNQHPEITTQDNIKNMSEQLDSLSLSHDKSRSFSTTDTKYYKWTQWIFLKLYNSYYNNISKKSEPIEDLKIKLESGKFIIEDGKLLEKEHQYSSSEIENLIPKMRLAYLDDVDVNWCPMLGTVLSNEEVKDGKSERGNHPVEKKAMKQWMLRITSYADRLDSQLDQLNWPQNIITMQKNWIGKQSGTNITFKTDHGDIDIFTTRPETLFGAAFIGISHQHSFVKKIGLKSSEEQIIGYAIHPVTKNKIPVWITDYVLNEYGTGAVMAVPAHDQRDFEFSKRHNIKFNSVIRAHYSWLVDNYSGESPNSELLSLWKKSPHEFDNAFESKGPLFYPEQFEITETISVKNQIKQAIKFIESHSGKEVTNYRLRDWLFSRQRYWGEPFPIVFDENKNAYSISEECLPITLPEQYDFKPTINQENAEPPLSKAEEWKTTRGIILKNGSVKTLYNSDPYHTDEKTFTRELNTMPNWAGSCWYYLRYMDSENENSFVSKEALEYWSSKESGTIDMYVGGAEHAVLHLLYSRFWHMVLFDLGYVPNPEPFHTLVNPGMMTADAYSNERGIYIDIEDVELKNKEAFQISTGEKLNIEPGKMGKRYKNGLDPRDACNKYGIDVFRLHVMYMAPISQTRSWSISNIKGMERFHRSVFTKITDCIENQYDKSKNVSDLHKTIKFVTEEISNMRFNTAIASLIKFSNNITQLTLLDCISFLQMLYPFAPHLSENLYQEIKKQIKIKALYIEQIIWPQYDPKLLEESTINLPVRINGKVRDILVIEKNSTDDEIKNLIKENIKIQKHITNEIKKYLIIRKEYPVIVNIII